MSKIVRKSATIKTLEGITFADPTHEPGVWCRYDKLDTLHNVRIDYTAQVRDGYNDFTLIIQPNADKPHIESYDLDTLLRPESYEESQHEVGLDSACVYFGPYQAKGEWGCGFNTGADGMFGSVHEFTSKNQWAGTVLVGSFDTCFETPESLWSGILASFGATEQGKTKKRSKAA